MHLTKFDQVEEWLPIKSEWCSNWVNWYFKRDIRWSSNHNPMSYIILYRMFVSKPTNVLALRVYCWLKQTDFVFICQNFSWLCLTQYYSFLFAIEFVCVLQHILRLPMSPRFSSFDSLAYMCIEIYDYLLTFVHIFVATFGWSCMFECLPRKRRKENRKA